MTLVHLRKAQSGIMLLEAMIGILIFSLGILALIGMQAIATKTVIESRSRAEAGKLANGLLGDMWLNRVNLANYAYVGSGSAPSTLSNFITQVNATLPNANSYPPIISVAAPQAGLAGVTGNEVIVTIRWQAPGGALRQYQTTAYIN